MNQLKTQAKKVALVTGGARRVGAAIVKALHQNGFDVAIHCHHSKQEARALAQALNHVRKESAQVFTADLCDKKAAITLVDDVVSWKNQLDCLVNNASVFIKTPLGGEVADAVWDELFTANVKVPFWLSEAAHASLKQSENGNIINITDVHAEKPLTDYIIYTQTKAALKLQTESLARAYAPNVRANAVAPGAVILPEGQNALSDEVADKIRKKIPLKRFGDALWVAQAVLSLVNNPYITGDTLRVDGGRYIA